MENSQVKKKSSNLTSLVAILSVIIIFFLVCFFVMFILYKMGVYKLPNSFLSQKVETNESIGNLNNIEDYSVGFITYGYSDSLHKKILKSIPIQHSFHIQADITTYDENNKGITYHYWIWKYYDRYRIAILDYETYSPIKLIICDGENVKVEFAQTNQSEYHSIDEGYTFSEQIPIIDFSFLDDEDDLGYIESANQKGKQIDYIVQYTLIDEIIKISIDVENYIPLEYEISRKGKNVSEFKLLNFENADYFTPEQFTFK